MTEDAYDKLIRQCTSMFPGLVTFTRREFRTLGHDRHSIVFGEVRRLRMLQKRLKEERTTLVYSSLTPEQRHRVLLRTIHGHFVGDPDDEPRHARMYYGTSADFAKDRKIWRDACADVEAFYGFLIERLPRLTKGRVRRWDLHRKLRRPDVVCKAWDPLILLELAFAGGKSLGEKRVRHFARQKLVLAQASWEFRRGYLDPRKLADRSEQLEAFIKRSLFGEGKGERAHIVCDLDPRNAYRCKKWRYLEPGEPIPETHRLRVVLPVTRYYVATPDGSERIPLLFFIRPKKHLLIKALNKRIRFQQLAGIGDGVAMLFVVEHEHLDKVVEQVRRILVRCPGQVCDQGSSVGHRNGQQVDKTNAHSSADYEVMKYICLLWDWVVEFQFVPTISWANAKCSHNRVNHEWYKSMQVAAQILPVCFPDHLFGIGWPRNFDEHGMPSINPGLWGEMIAHVLRRGYEF